MNILERFLCQSWCGRFWTNGPSGPFHFSGTKVCPSPTRGYAGTELTHMPVCSLPGAVLTCLCWPGLIMPSTCLTCTLSRQVHDCVAGRASPSQERNRQEVLKKPGFGNQACGSSEATSSLWGLGKVTHNPLESGLQGGTNENTGVPPLAWRQK